MFKKFPQIAKYAANPPDTERALFRVDPSVISLLDYRRGFGHTALVDVWGYSSERRAAHAGDAAWLGAIGVCRPAWKVG